MTTITEFANELYNNSRAHGFYDHEDWLRGEANAARSEYVLPQPAEVALTEHFGNRLMLIVGEAVEAHEELRAGHGVGELYFSDGSETFDTPFHPENTSVMYKPEGVLAELADVAIRTLETMAGILAQLSPEEATKLRGQVPQSEHTEHHEEPDVLGGPAPEVVADPVSVAEILNLKHEYNLSRAPRHGGKAF